jgi:hypothetical protein
VSSFVVGITTATFTADQDGFNERTEPQSGLRVWTFKALLALTTDYTTLFSLQSWLVTKRAMPGGASTTRYADVGGGAGRGTLTLDNVVGSPFFAVLTQINRPSAYPSGARYAQVTFEEVP